MNIETLHWTEYAIEAALLGTFMCAACAAVTSFEHPDSPVRRSITHPLVRRAMIGVLMGLTAIALIYSPWGQRSGAHLNPVVTLTFCALGKVRATDAVGYVAAQFLGGLGGVVLARTLLGRLVLHERVRCAATLPGKHGVTAAFVAETVIALLMMSMVLYSTNRESTAPFTGIFAGVMVSVFITVEAPYSGMSMNPARTLASAVPSRLFRGLWVYFTAPALGMGLAAAIHLTLFGHDSVYCCKMQHPRDQPCIFECRVDRLHAPRETNLAR